jgi:hypothetical protein
MFRLTFSLSGPTERERVAAALNAPAIGDIQIISAFADETRVDVYLESRGTASLREVAADVARRLGLSEYEVSCVDPLCNRAAIEPNPDRAPRRSADITQVRIDVDDCTLSVQARHRPHEMVDTVEVQQTDDAVMITALVYPVDNVTERYASFGIAFTWVDTVLDRPLGNRRVIRHAPDRDAHENRRPGSRRTSG